MVCKRADECATPRILFAGSDCSFSAMVLKRLVEAQCAVCVVILGESAPNANGRLALFGHLPSLPVVQPHTASGLCARWGIPLRYVDNSEMGAIGSALREFQAEIIVAACFPYLFPPSILRLPKLGGINVHPSLLPAYRGPAPLFWQFRSGERHGGISVHVMTEQVDAGNIIAQQQMFLPAGISDTVAGPRLADLGGQMVCAVMRDFQRGPVTAILQQEHKGSYHPWPQRKDFCVSLGWSAERAFRFIRGTASWGQPHNIVVGQSSYWIQRAVGFESYGALQSPSLWRDGELWLQCTPGVLRVIPMRASIEKLGRVFLPS